MMAVCKAAVRSVSRASGSNGKVRGVIEWDMTKCV